MILDKGPGRQGAGQEMKSGVLAREDGLQGTSKEGEKQKRGLHRATLPQA